MGTELHQAFDRTQYVASQRRKGLDLIYVGFGVKRALLVADVIE